MRLAALAAIASLLVLAGCNSSNNNGCNGTSPAFIGGWNGPQLFRDIFGNAQDQGSMSISVDICGEVRGVIIKDSPFDSVPITGYINSNGSCQFNWQFSGESARRASGTVIINGSGSMVPQGGALGVTNNSGPVGTLEFTLD